MALFSLYSLSLEITRPSNGIRFSITNLRPTTARILPTVFKDRCGISLYDAQYNGFQKVPIPEPIIQGVISALRSFKRTCADFRVPASNIRVLATEATREAINSTDFCCRIEAAIRWKVEMLDRSDEGRMGAWGIASSFSSAKGLVLDLGGGSVQLSWIDSHDGEVDMPSSGSMSLPYGAAALTQRLADVEAQRGDAKVTLQQKITRHFAQALEELEVPERIMTDDLRLYLSGGGFRGWGYILMASHPIQPYPITSINGFSAPMASFRPEKALEVFTAESAKPFRVSNRRASQVPAVSFLITALLEALPPVKLVAFAQGGVREGVHFSSLPRTVRSQNPLVAATQPHAPHSAQVLASLLERGINALRDDELGHWETESLRFADAHFCLAMANILIYHAPLPRDLRAAAALRCTTTGVLAAAHGVSHQERAVLGLALCQRWGGEIGPSDADFHRRLVGLVGAKSAWWAGFFGRLAAGLGAVWPAGIVREEEQRVKIGLKFAENKKGEREIGITIHRGEGVNVDWAEDLKKWGKLKNWIDGAGCRVGITIIDLVD